jgi:RNA polymerase sigma factor (sigma-70 family)
MTATRDAPPARRDRPHPLSPLGERGFEEARAELGAYVTALRSFRGSLGDERRQRKRALRREYADLKDKSKREALIRDALLSWEAEALNRHACGLRGSPGSLATAEALSGATILHLAAAWVRRRRPELRPAGGGRRAMDGDEAQADIAADVTIAMFIHYTRPRLLEAPWRSYRGFLWRVTRDQSRTYFRSRRRRRQRLQPTDALPEASDEALGAEERLGALDELGERSRRQRDYLVRLQELLPSLAPGHQQVLRLRYLERLTRREITAALSKAEARPVPAGTVSGRLNRGRLQLTTAALDAGAPLPEDFFTVLDPTPPPGEPSADVQTLGLVEALFQRLRGASPPTERR